MYLFAASRAPQPGLIRNGQVMAALEAGDGRSIYIFIFVQIALAFGATFQPEHRTSTSLQVGRIALGFPADCFLSTTGLKSLLTLALNPNMPWFTLEM